MSVNTKVNGQLVPSAGLYKVSVPIQNGDIYSEQERQVGVFVDGKPLYQKTVYFGALPNATTKTVAHGISNLERCVGIDVIARNTTSGNNRMIPISSTVSLVSQADRYVTDTNVAVVTGQDMSAYDEAYITLRYTKTTDVAGSGIYVPSGDKAVHYSENEEVIGTWIDGSTLYRRVFDLGSDVTITNNAFTATTIDASNMRTLISARALYSTGVTVYNVMANINNDIIRLQADRNDNVITARYIILEYTKTS